MVSVKINFVCQLAWATGAQIKPCFWEFLGAICISINGLGRVPSPMESGITQPLESLKGNQR